MANVNYRVKLYSRTGAYLADLSEELTNRRRSVILNGIDEFGFGLSTRATNSGLVQPLKTFVRVWRDVEGRAPRPENLPNFCGWVASPTRSAKSKTMTFKAYAPVWRLQHRFHFDKHDFSDPTAKGAPLEAIDNTPKTPSEIIWQMITYTAQILSGTWGDDYMGLSLGSLNTLNEEIWYDRYPRGQNTWKLLDDFLAKRIFDLYLAYWNDPGEPQTLAKFNTLAVRGMRRDSPKFEYGVGSDNLEDITEVVITDPNAVANYVVVQGPGDTKADRSIWIANGSTNGTWTRPGAPAVTLPDTLNEYGIYMSWMKNELALFADQRDATAYRKLSRSAYAPQVLSCVFPTGSDSGFEHDWDVGDGMLASCDEGAMQFTDVRRRVARVDLTLDDLGAESTNVTLVEDYTAGVSS